LSSTPSARTSYVCGSTSILGSAALCTMSRLVMRRVPFTATARFWSRSFSGSPASSAACETKVTLVVASAPPTAPNM
jgi:hypothetical protein